MVCVVNPDGTITCSDGDAAIAREQTAVAKEAKKGGKEQLDEAYSVELGSLLKAVAIMLRQDKQPMAMILVDAAVVDTA